LTNYDIIKACKGLKYFRGVFLIKELPKKPWKNELGVVNLDISEEKIGSHWVCYMKRGNTIKFCDPVGDVYPPKLLQDYFNGCKVMYNVTKLQRDNTVNCGQICVRFLHGYIV